MNLQKITRTNKGDHQKGSVPAAKQSSSLKSDDHPLLYLQQTIGNQVVLRLIRSGTLPTRLPVHVFQQNEKTFVGQTGVGILGHVPEMVARKIDNKDEELIKDVKKLTSPKLKLFLTGRGEKSLAEKIKKRVNEQVNKLNKKIREENKDRQKKKLKKLKMLRPFSSFRPFGVPTEGQGKPSGREKGGQGRIVFDKFFVTLSRKKGWDSLPQEYWVKKEDPKKPCKATDPKKRQKMCLVDRKKWLGEPSEKRLKIILQFSAVPGASRHHWGTEVDFNSAIPEDWGAGGDLQELGTWLQENAQKSGFAQVYVSGRKGGHEDEPWHWSYTPLSIPLLEMYKKDIDTDNDVVKPIIEFFKERASAAGEKLPSDFEEAIKKINIKEYVTEVAPGL